MQLTNPDEVWKIIKISKNDSAIVFDDIPTDQIRGRVYHISTNLYSH